MTPEAAIAYAPVAIRDLGYEADKYHLDFKHFVLQADEKMVINAYNTIFILVEEPGNVSVTSYMGTFDVQYKVINELKYVHTGKIVIKNTDPDRLIARVRFVQVIPFKENQDGRFDQK